MNLRTLAEAVLPATLFVSTPVGVIHRQMLGAGVVVESVGFGDFAVVGEKRLFHR